MTYKEYQHQYYLKNKELLLLNRQQRYIENRTIELVKTLVYRQANPEKVALWDAICRCHNPNHQAYKYYGGRGIKCFFTSPKELIAEIGRRPRKGYSLDRINNDGHYEPGNVRWATAKQQANNKRVK